MLSVQRTGKRSGFCGRGLEEEGAAEPGTEAGQSVGQTREGKWAGTGCHRSKDKTRPPQQLAEPTCTWKCPSGRRDGRRVTPASAMNGCMRGGGRKSKERRTDDPRGPQGTEGHESMLQRF